MKRFLVATDFSEPAKVATRYACCLAEALQAEVLLYHAVSMEGPGHPPLEVHAHSLMEHLVAQAKTNALSTLEGFKGAGFANIPIDSKIEHANDPVRALCQAASEWKAELVIIGTQGSGAVAATLLGSMALRAIEECKLPTLVVPRHARYYGLRKVLLATDLRNTAKETATIRTLTEPESPTIRTVHLRNPDEHAPLGKGDVLDLVSTDWPATLDFQIMETTADWLAMTVHPHGLFHRLFGRDLVLRMAFHSSIPLLALRP